jgi:hypothetical protein
MRFCCFSPQDASHIEFFLEAAQFPRRLSSFFALADSILIATQFNETSNFVLLPAPHSSKALAS